MKSTMLSDQALLEMYQQGNREAVSQLLARYDRRIRDYIRVAVKDNDVADDLAQEVLIKVAIDLCSKALAELLEKSLSKETEEEILSIISATPKVQKPHNLRTRRIGSDIAIEVHIRVEGTMTVFESHEISRDIERSLRQRYGERTAVAIHIEPMK